MSQPMSGSVRRIVSRRWESSAGATSFDARRSPDRRPGPHRAPAGLTGLAPARGRLGCHSHHRRPLPGPAGGHLRGRASGSVVLVTNSQQCATCQVIREAARRLQIEERLKNSENGHRDGFRLRGCTRHEPTVGTGCGSFSCGSLPGSPGRSKTPAGRRICGPTPSSIGPHAGWKAGLYVWREFRPALDVVLPWQPRRFVASLARLTKHKWGRLSSRGIDTAHVHAYDAFLKVKQRLTGVAPG